MEIDKELVKFEKGNIWAEDTPTHIIVKAFYPPLNKTYERKWEKSIIKRWKNIYNISQLLIDMSIRHLEIDLRMDLMYDEKFKG